MPSAKLVKMDGAEVGTIELDAAIFDVPLNERLVRDVVVALQGARRQGNAETKTRKEVQGGGRKPYRQKGTGSARHGSIREPQMRGGGTVFGPHKRSYRQDVPRAFRQKALCCALSDRLRAGSLWVLEELRCEGPKTRVFAEMVSRVAPGNKSTLLVTAQADRNVWLSARNLSKVSVRPVSDVNALDVVGAGQVVIVQDALARLGERLASTVDKERSR